MIDKRQVELLSEDAEEKTKDIPVNRDGLTTAYLRGKLQGYKECLSSIFPEGEKNGEGTGKSAA